MACEGQLELHILGIPDLDEFVSTYSIKHSIRYSSPVHNLGCRPAVASHRPLGENLALLTPCVCPFRVYLSTKFGFETAAVPSSRGRFIFFENNPEPATRVQ